jgi:hypothetical protein
MTVFDIIRTNYTRYIKKYGSHDKVAAQLKIDFASTTQENWDYYSKQPLEWWKNNYNLNWKPPASAMTPEEWKKENGFTGRPKGWKKPYSKFTKDELLIKAMKEDIKNKDYTRRLFYSSDSEIGLLFDKLEKAIAG